MKKLNRNRKFALPYLVFRSATTSRVIVAIISLLFLNGLYLAAAPGTEPSNAAELKAKKTEASYDVAADAKRKLTLSPEAAAWETVLEQNLGDYYLPVYKKEKLAGKVTAWDYVQDDPKLPRVLLIGDSISRGYTLAVRNALVGKVNVHRAPANCGPTALGLKKLSVWLGDGKWDVIHFNFGIHDRKTEEKIYAANLEQIVAELEKTGAKLIWARTTPPPPNKPEVFSSEECDRVNRVADVIMQKHHIPEDDLYATIAPLLSQFQTPNDVHFNNDGYEILGKHVTKEILEVMRKPPATGTPASTPLLKK